MNDGLVLCYEINDFVFIFFPSHDAI